MNQDTVLEREWQYPPYERSDIGKKLSGLPPSLRQYYLLLSWPLQFGLAPAVESR